MNFITADVRALHEHVPAASYDVALDKGCLDAIYNRLRASKTAPPYANVRNGWRQFWRGMLARVRGRRDARMKSRRVRTCESRV